MNPRVIAGKPREELRRKIVCMSPALAAVVYPFLLQAFHLVVVSPCSAFPVTRLAAAAMLLTRLRHAAVGVSRRLLADRLTGRLSIEPACSPVGLLEPGRAAPLCFRRRHPRTAGERPQPYNLGACAVSMTPWKSLTPTTAP